MDIKKLRTEAGLTLKALGKAAGISEGAACLIENGKRRPSVKVAKRIASALGFDWTEFYEKE